MRAGSLKSSDPQPPVIGANFLDEGRALTEHAHEHMPETILAAGESNNLKTLEGLRKHGYSRTHF